jgi:hypothetical protein
MPDVIFPALQSPNWKLTRTPQWLTLRQESASGKLVRASLRSRPLWKWTLKNGVLQAQSTIADLQAIQDFFNDEAQGMANSFLWRDPEDTTIQDAAVQVDVDGVLYWRVALLEDAIDLERFAYELWQVGSISFSQVRN